MLRFRRKGFEDRFRFRVLEYRGCVFLVGIGVFGSNFYVFRFDWWVFGFFLL